jgi:Holliday junction resolvase RusA-like endonuclease
MDADADEMIHFVVPVKPVAQPRHSVTARGGFVKHYIPSSHPVHAYRQAIIAEAMKHRKRGPIEGPVRLECVFAFKKTGRNRRGWRIARPDLDNLEKAVMDALTEAGIWLDDSQVAEKASGKIDSASDCVSIKVQPMGFNLPGQ